MKHEFKTTKTTKNVNNLLPATDEELGLELLRIFILIISEAPVFPRHWGFFFVDKHTISCNLAFVNIKLYVFMHFYIPE